MITELLLEGYSMQALTGVSPVRSRPTSVATEKESSPSQESSPAYRLDISDAGRQKVQESKNTENEKKDSQKQNELTDSKDSQKQNELTDSEKEQVKELKDRDREVRAHEAAHMAAAGGNARGGASYEYQQGPDGNRYAVGGEVNIDVSQEEDPRATLQKAMQVKAAALAPAEPSGQDHSVAAQATAMAAEARKEIAEESKESPTDKSQESKADSNENAAQEWNTKNSDSDSEVGVRIPKAYQQAQSTGYNPRSWVA